MACDALDARGTLQGTLVVYESRGRVRLLKHAFIHQSRELARLVVKASIIIQISSKDD